MRNKLNALVGSLHGRNSETKFFNIDDQVKNILAQFEGKDQIDKYAVGISV